MEKNKFKKHFSLMIFPILALLWMATPLCAGPIVVDAGWYGFCFGGDGSPATAGCQNQGIDTTGNTFTFTAMGPVWFNITDAFQKGDTFLVKIDSDPVGFTTPTVLEDVSTTGNPDLAFADPSYSHSSVLLGIGPHTIDVFAAHSPYGSGGAYLEVVTPVPEPASMLLIGSGLIGLAGYGRKKLFKK